MSQSGLRGRQGERITVPALLLGLVGLSLVALLSDLARRSTPA